MNRDYACSSFHRAISRRHALKVGGLGLLGLNFPRILNAEAVLAEPGKIKARAKSVIFCFMEGGPSQIDLFDPKPALEKYAGQPIPPSFKPETLGVTGFGTAKNGLLPSKRVFKQHGKSGLWVSDWLPHLAQHVDDMAIIRSCQSDAVNHVGGVCQMNTGDILAGRPSLGAWVTYGLGSAKRNLPAFVVMQDDKEILGGIQNYSAGFLPAVA